MLVVPAGSLCSTVSCGTLANFASENPDRYIVAPDCRTVLSFAHEAIFD